MANNGSFKSGDGRARRPKGTPNKMTALLKDMILQALSDAGGVSYLTAQATKNPNAFMTLVGRVLPLQVKADGDDPRVPGTIVKHIYLDTSPGQPVKTSILAGAESPVRDLPRNT
jgi:hypothetical protein